MVWEWFQKQGIIGGAISMWLGSIPVVTGAGTWIHKVTERRHRERLQLQRQMNTQMLTVLHNDRE